VQDAETPDGPFVGQSLMRDVLCAAADAGIISEHKFARLMQLHDQIVHESCILDDDLQAACLPQLAADAADAWRAFGAYVARCLACAPLARARALRANADANAADAATMLHGMSLQPAAQRPVLLPLTNGSAPGADFMGSVASLMRTAMYQKDLDAILRGAFPCRAREDDVMSLAYFSSQERLTALVAQQQGAV
jgi:hypothetical protein